MTNTPQYNPRAASPWPFRLAVSTWLAAIPLLLFGGSVTTLEAGMAIDGWWILEPGRGDHFLLFYPIEKWFRDLGTFSEHTHRLFGILVGNLAIATLVATWMKDPRKRARSVALGALALICLQGWVGGSRVLESSPELAFLHGALAQIVFAVLAWSAVYLSPRFLNAQLNRKKETSELLRACMLAISVVYAAIFAGAWLRHAFSDAALGVHLLLVTLAAVVVLHLAGLLKRYATDDPQKKPLRSAARCLHVLLGLQFVLGAASFWIVVMVADKKSADVHHSVYPTLHVLFGALILAQLAGTSIWTQRLLALGVEPEPHEQPADLEFSA